eukprot:15860853-Heterocapsa_arctica.AAC.1
MVCAAVHGSSEPKYVAYAIKHGTSEPIDVVRRHTWSLGTHTHMWPAPWDMKPQNSYMWPAPSNGAERSGVPIGPEGPRAAGRVRGGAESA